MATEIDPEDRNLQDKSPSEGNVRPANEKDRFVYPKASYRGQFTPENLLFDANLQEFAQRVALICALETGGKLPPVEAYNQIRALWEQLSRSEAMLLDNASQDPPTSPPEN